MGTAFFILMKQEWIVIAIVFLLLIIKVGWNDIKNEKLLNGINILLLFNFLAGFFGNQSGSLFNEMYHTSPLIVGEKQILNLAVYIISLQSYDWLRKQQNAMEFYLLLLSTLIGMFVLISAGNLLLFYLGLELSSIPLAALVNFDLEKRKSSEAAFKYIISSAFSSGLLLFGISLVYGTTGTLLFSALPGHLNGSPVQLYAFILLIAGFGFKISAVPFHLWTADVYEGAPVPVTAYLSVVSKGAVLFALASTLYTVFKPFSITWFHLLIVLALLTMITGNLFAIRQQNLKRFLAFSSISQVGFILIGISGNSQAGAASLVYFILIYLFSNLGAFGVIGLVSTLTGKENIDDYKGFYKTNKLLSWVLVISLFSLAGIPPTAGFFGKFFLLLAGAARGNYWIIAAASLNMIVSLYYYLRVVRAVFMDSNDQPILTLAIHRNAKLAFFICMAGIVLAGVMSYVYEFIYSLFA